DAADRGGGADALRGPGGVGAAGGAVPGAGAAGDRRAGGGPAGGGLPGGGGRPGAGAGRGPGRRAGGDGAVAAVPDEGGAAGAAANECIGKARAALEAFLAANPGSLEALLEQLRLESAESMRRASGVPFEELAAAHAELLERVAEAARTLEPGKVDDAVAAFAA